MQQLRTAIDAAWDDRAALSPSNAKPAIREAVDETPASQPEPVNGTEADTSVNRDIDRQLARAQEAAAADTNLLEPPPAAP